MRRIKVLSLFLGAGLGAASVPWLLPGCALCEDYLECTSRPGLRYIECSRRKHEFNDGATLDDPDAAFDYCFCSATQLACLDGRRLRMCNYMTYDGTAGVWYDDGGSAELLSAMTLCRGYESCEIAAERCNYGGWYLRCTKPSGGREFITVGGATLASETDAVRTCVVPGASGLGYCEARIDDCSELPSCAGSAACAEYCSSPSCYDNDTFEACIADPACRWSP